jgi:hypothetical protein
MAYKFIKNATLPFPKVINNIIYRYLDPNPKWVKYWKDENIKEIKEIFNRKLYTLTTICDNDATILQIITDLYYIYDRKYKRGLYKYEIEYMPNLRRDIEKKDIKKYYVLIKYF